MMFENSSLLDGNLHMFNYQTMNESTKNTTAHLRQLDKINKNLTRERDELLRRVKLYNFVEIMYKFALGFGLIFGIIIVLIGIIYYPNIIVEFFSFVVQYIWTKICLIYWTIIDILTNNLFWIILILIPIIIYLNLIKIYIKVVQVRTFGIRIFKSYSVLEVKGIIEKKLHIDQEAQILQLANGVELSNNCTMGDYSISNNQIIYLTSR